MTVITGSVAGGSARRTFFPKCAQVGTLQGSKVAVMNGVRKPLSVFQEDRSICNDLIKNDVSGATHCASNRLTDIHFVDTMLGASLGAAMRGAQGAAVDAGAPCSAAVGSIPGASAQVNTVSRYDLANTHVMATQARTIPITQGGQR